MTTQTKTVVAVTAISNRVSALADTIYNALRLQYGARLVSLFLPVAPVPASRPRVTRFGGVYYGKPYKRFYDAAKDWFIDGGPRPEIAGPIVMLIETIVAKPKTGKLDYPKGDVDNFVKGPLDAMTNKLWEGRPIKDDNQIVGLAAFKRYAEPGEEPGVNINYVGLENG